MARTPGRSIGLLFDGRAVCWWMTGDIRPSAVPGESILEGADTASFGAVPVHGVGLEAERPRASPPPQKLLAALRRNAIEEPPISAEKDGSGGGL